MKRIITITISGYLFFMFLVYSGVFRDNNDPLDVAKFYLQSLKNRQGALTYRICKPGFFDEDRGGTTYSKYRMHLIDNIKLDIMDMSDNYAHVRARISYKDEQVLDALIGLERIDKAWLICGLE